MAYMQQIAKDFLSNIDNRQFTIRNVPTSEGVSVSKEQFYQLILRRLDDKSKFAQLTKDFGSAPFTCKSLKNFLKIEHKFNFFTPQLFYRFNKRTKDDLSCMTCFVLDFDLKKDGTNREYSANRLADVIFNEFELYPHFIYETETPGNYNAVFLLNEVYATEKSIFLFEAILKRMAILLGADIGSTDATHIFRCPTKTIFNYKSVEHIYDINDFKFILEDPEIEQALEKKRNEFLNGKVIDLTEQKIMRQPSVKKLEGCEIDSHRNHACFTLALLYYTLGKDQREVEDFLLNHWYKEANDARFSTYFSKREIKDCVKSAYSTKYAGPSRDWIEFLTGEHFPVNIYRSSYVKKSEGERVYMSQNTLRARLIEWIKVNSGEIVKQKELAAILDIPLRSLQYQIKKLKEEGILEVQTQRGKNGKSMFRLKQNKFIAETEGSFTLEHSLSENALKSQKTPV